jgi:CHAT domain-containing protein
MKGLRKLRRSLSFSKSFIAAVILGPLYVYATTTTVSGTEAKQPSSAEDLRTTAQRLYAKANIHLAALEAALRNLGVRRTTDTEGRWRYVTQIGSLTPQQELKAVIFLRMAAEENVSLAIATYSLSFIKTGIATERHLNPYLIASLSAGAAGVRLAVDLRARTPLEDVGLRRKASDALRLVLEDRIKFLYQMRNDKWATETAFRSVEMARAIDLRELLETRRWLIDQPALLHKYALVEALGEVADAKERLASTSGTGQEHDTQELIKRLSALSDRFDHELGGIQGAAAVGAEVRSVLQAKRADLSAATGVIDPFSLAYQLPFGSLVVLYQCTAEGCFLFALHPSGKVRFESIATDSTALQSDINLLSTALSQPIAPTPRIRAMLRSLGNTLFSPIADWLAETTDLAVVPDGSMFGLPIAVLSLPDGRGSLVEQMSVRLWPSADFSSQAFGRRPADSDTPLVVGRSIFSSLPALPEAEHEAQEVARTIAPVEKPVIGAAATRNTLLQRIQQANIIHIASHAHFEPAAPLASWIALATPSGDDDLLTAVDILTLSLSANLVTLSACETGSVKGEGVTLGDDPLSLARAFLAAGARSVVASYWPVNDAATTQFMLSFYGHIRAGSGAAEALRAAQREFLDAGRPPYLWAGFYVLSSVW